MQCGIRGTSSHWSAPRKSVMRDRAADARADRRKTRPRSRRLACGSLDSERNKRGQAVSESEAALLGALVGGAIVGLLGIGTTFLASCSCLRLERKRAEAEEEKNWGRGPARMVTCDMLECPASLMYPLAAASRISHFRPAPCRRRPRIPVLGGQLVCCRWRGRRARARSRSRSRPRPLPSRRRPSTRCGRPRTRCSPSARRLLVLLVLLASTDAGTVWSFVGADDQERRAIVVLEVHLRRWVEVEVGEAGLVEDLAGLGHRVLS